MFRQFQRVNGVTFAPEPESIVIVNLDHVRTVEVLRSDLQNGCTFAVLTYVDATTETVYVGPADMSDRLGATRFAELLGVVGAPALEQLIHSYDLDRKFPKRVRD